MQPSEISELLRNLNCGSPTDWDRLAPLVYRELHRQASLCMKKEGGPHLLQTTALIHECYLRLYGSRLGSRTSASSSPWRLI